MRLISGERKETNSEEKKEGKKWEEVGRRREKRKLDKHAERMSKGRVQCLIAPPLPNPFEPTLGTSQVRS